MISQKFKTKNNMHNHLPILVIYRIKAIEILLRRWVENINQETDIANYKTCKEQFGEKNYTGEKAKKT